MKTNCKKVSGFTLIELLVVISIIAILMSIMMPALQKAREQAKFVICKSNIKNMGLAGILWSEENDGWALPGLWDRGYNGDSLLQPYLGGAESGEGVGLCASLPAKYAGKTYGELGFSSSDLAGTALSTGNFFSSFGYNQMFFNDTSTRLGTYDSGNDNNTQWGKDNVWYNKHGNTKVNTIRKSSEIVMFAESYMYLSSPWVYNKAIVNPKFSNPADRGRRHFAKKRRVVGTTDSEIVGRMTVAWMDGTVSEEPEDMEQVKANGRGYEIASKYWNGK